ncbi:MAG: HAMP domain-containing histidine kinase [Calditrichales bacterium]|nr:MAG: HAMP domain-containing histidine kinase [Calditrichales bacterium]
MKLKYKLFISYFVLIVFISIALFLLILQLKGIDHFIKVRIEQDVQEVVDLSRQQQVLEDIYSHYLLIRLPGSEKNRHLQNLDTAMDDYARNWRQYKSRRESIIEFSFWTPIDQFISDQFFDPGIQNSIRSGKDPLEQKCETYWHQAERTLKVLLKTPDMPSPDLKRPINNLRDELILLGEMIGQQARESGVRMREASDQLNMIIWWIMLGLVFISLLIAFWVARLFSHPLEDLKIAVEQVAIQNFDVTVPSKSNDEIGELAAAFEQMALRLKKNEKFKMDMLGQFTHEMKSPLAAIGQAIILLENTLGHTPTADQRRLLTIINGNNETLSTLITNILHSATYEAGKMKLDKQQQNVTKLFTNTIMKLAPTIKEKEMKVNMKFSSERIECPVDKDRLEEVFINLVSNAVKFSRNGSSLHISITDHHSTVDFQIRDEGIGIPQKEIPYIFEKMYRASNSTKISVKGTGLGLYLTSQIVKAHGGKIKVRSKENVGTEFIVQLPRNFTPAMEEAS